MLASRGSRGHLRPFRAHLAACEERLAEVVGGHVPEISGPAGRTRAAGGKRLRPLLVFCCARDEARSGPEVMSAAAAVELVHMATLVHDDIIDGATMRRGEPSIAHADGPEVALRVGDFLFARAFAELTRAGSAPAVQILAAAALDLSRGELLQQEGAFDLDITEEIYRARCWGKTASLFAAACRLGAITGGVDDEQAHVLASFGEDVGLAFQIFDDILDIVGDPEVTGKPRGTDLIDGTITLPLIYAMQDDSSVRARLESIGHHPELIDGLCADLVDHPGVHRARRRAHGFVDSAREAVVGLDGVATDALIAIADAVVDRYT